MNLPLRRAARLAALCLAVPAAAQMETAAKIASTPFGTYSRAWAGALGGAMLKPDGLLTPYVFPRSFAYDAAKAAAPDEAVLHRLAPVAVALENAGLTPSYFQTLDPVAQAKQIQAILPDSEKLVNQSAMQAMARAGELKDGEKATEIVAEMNDLLSSYPGYTDMKTHLAYAAAFKSVIALRGRRVMGQAQAAANALTGPAATAVAEPVRTDARVAELKILENSLETETARPTAERSLSLAETGAPNEAAQMAALRLSIRAAEVLHDEGKEELDPQTAIDGYLQRLTAVATQSPYFRVQSLAVNTLLDNALGRRGAPGDAFQSERIKDVQAIALASKSAAVKEETISLLLRELETTRIAVVKDYSRKAIDAIRAGMSSEPSIVKAPAKQVAAVPTGNAVAAFIVLFGGFAGLYGAANLLLPIALVGIALMFLGVWIAPREPWYRRDDGQK